jgi:predicted SprT family Zn-dependent metalloprotease
MASNWQLKRRFKPSDEELKAMMTNSQHVKFGKGKPEYMEDRVRGVIWKLIDPNAGEYEEYVRGEA